MVLHINAKEPAITQKEIDEEDGILSAECDFTEVDQHLFSRLRIEYVGIRSSGVLPRYRLSRCLPESGHIS